MRVGGEFVESDHFLCLRLGGIEVDASRSACSFALALLFPLLLFGPEDVRWS